MPSPLIIDTDQQDTVALSADQSSVTIAAGITVAGPDTGTGFGIDATLGAGGKIVIDGSVSGGGGIYDPSSTRAGYDVVVHAQGSIVATKGFAIALQNEATITNHGRLSAQQVGISIGAGDSTIINNGLIEAARAIQTFGQDSTIVNAGTIHAVVDGIWIVAGMGSTITNSGQINAGRWGILIADNQSAGVIITNTGSITADNLAVRGNTTDDQLVNHGSVYGHIDLREGADFLDNRLGIVAGKILLGSGNDTALGGEGGDTISDWIGDDFIDAGGGIDTLDYELSEDANLAVHVDLRIQTAQTSAWGTDTFLNFENVNGGAADDTITGSDGENVLKGGGGADSLAGAKGNDTLVGGDGNDMLDGGEGVDTAVYDGAAITTVDLRLEIAQDTGHGTDSLIGIENVVGGFASDRLFGNSASNMLVGNDSADLLSGDAGDDVLDGGKGNDILQGAAGSDTAVFSGARSDYAIVNNSDGSVTVTDNRAGNDGTDTLTGIEFFRFADQTLSWAPSSPNNPVPNTPSSTTFNGTARADRFTGGDGDDLIYGHAGNDVLDAGQGNDTIWGGAGKDKMTGGTGRDTFVFDSKVNAKTNLDRITDFRPADDSIWLENKIFTKIGKGTLAKPVKLNAKMFWNGHNAHDADDRIIYDRTKGALYYDQDGTGSKAAVQIAVLTKKLKITAADFFVI